jgi:hypothetical protein
MVGRKRALLESTDDWEQLQFQLDWRIFTGRVNDFLVVGINALGIVFLAWLRAWRRRFGW